MATLPDKDQVARALQFLAETDVEYGQSCARVSAVEHQGKAVKAVEYLKHTGPVAERTAQVESSQAYKDWVEELENAIADRETLRAKRKRAELTIEVWRSVNSARTKGNIL